MIAEISLFHMQWPALFDPRCSFHSRFSPFACSGTAGFFDENVTNINILQSRRRVSRAIGSKDDPDRETIFFTTL